MVTMTTSQSMPLLNFTVQLEKLLLTYTQNGGWSSIAENTLAIIHRCYSTSNRLGKHCKTTRQDDLKTGKLNVCTVWNKISGILEKKERHFAFVNMKGKWEWVSEGVLNSKDINNLLGLVLPQRKC